MTDRIDEAHTRIDALGEVVKGLAELWKKQDRGLQERIAEQQKHLDALTIALVTVAERFARTMGPEDAEGFINEVDAQLNGDGEAPP